MFCFYHDSDIHHVLGSWLVQILVAMQSSISSFPLTSQNPLRPVIWSA